jgi:hypothetical protein
MDCSKLNTYMSQIKHFTSTLETKMIGQGDTLKDHIQIMLWNKI